MTISVLSVASEAVPLVKTGGLADVVGALPAAVAAHGVAMTTLLPGYPAVMAAVAKGKTLHSWESLFGEPARLVAGSRAVALYHQPEAWQAIQRNGMKADFSWARSGKAYADPYAIELDRRFQQHPRLARFGEDTADLVPKALVPPALPECPPEPPRFTPGGLIYELNVRGFTMLHPDVPEAQRGTLAALVHPAVIAQFKRLHVTAVELMPIVAWIDERHLPPLGLSNAWGYTPVALMALDPGLAPGGIAELREVVAALHAEGIGVILDLVFNHTGESDALGGVLSLRGLDDAAYARDGEGKLINDTGCGNTLDFANPAVRQLALDTLRHFVRHCGVDGFRFDLAPIMARGPGFDSQAPIFAEIAADPLLADRALLAEPWDIGPGGYQLGRFPANWLEWNDRFRDDVRRFWRGDADRRFYRSVQPALPQRQFPFRA